MLIGGLFSQKLAAQEFPWRQEDGRRGYEEQAIPDNEEVGEILYSIPDPLKDEVSLKDYIFNDKLSREFEARYKEQFGRSSPEIIYSRTPYLTSNYTEGQSLTFDEVEYQQRQRKFGNFMLKRLVEFHIQNESKTNPQLKAVNNVKESVEKVDVSFSDNFKLRVKYHISSNTTRFSMMNPYLDFTIRMELARTLSFGDVLETVYSFQKSFQFSGTSHYLDYYEKQQRLDFTSIKQITPTVSASLLVSPFRDLEVSKNVFVIERLILAGVGIIF